ncbi:TetR family transcriptional regulator [Actinomycetospora endophytica]|uniref:TetR family transcriptional regulator n=1 Tax=Actinomycetospora endophytica TaxID=2291215 RepID=A0ABS8PIZ7_9PSEU|nr:TetR family transcriptional regulator [Actinomycetospora endophytica]
MHGYPRTSTQNVADAAGVNETLLFRHFQSKANLFDEAVLQPIVTTVEETFAEWAGDRPITSQDPAGELTSLIVILRTALADRRSDLVALIEAQAYAPELGPLLDRVDGQLREQGPALRSAARRTDLIAGPGRARAVLNFVVAMVAFRPDTIRAGQATGDGSLPEANADGPGAAEGFRSSRVDHRGRELRRVICVHAGEAFAEAGYKKTTTRAIAARASTAESTIFRYFRDKTELFDEAVVKPFLADVEAFTERWVNHRPIERDSDDRVALFLDALHQFLVDRRRTILVLFTVDEFGASAERTGRALDICTDLLLRAVSECACPADSTEKIRRSVAADVLAVALGSAVLDDSPAGNTRRVLAEEITRVVLRGTASTDLLPQ